MSDETPKQNANSQGQDDIETKAKAAASKAMETADKVGKIAEGAGQAFSAIKWVAIAIVFAFFAVITTTIYKAVKAPVVAAGQVADAVTDTVKSGAESVKDSASELINRWDIAISAPEKFNKQAERAFEVITEMNPAWPLDARQRLYWSANLSGHENKVCSLSMKFGSDSIDVLIAADNKDYAASKALGAKTNRMMRIVLRAPGDDVPLNVIWDNDAQTWTLKWRSTTMKKPLDDATALARVNDVLISAGRLCRR